MTFHGTALRRAVVLLAWAAPLAGQDPAPTAIPGLGALSFPVTTASARARREFLRGTLLLHLFHYAEAARAFRDAEALDPGFAMAYWGEAMASNWGVWNEQFPDSARAALGKLAPTPAARAAKAGTARERGYLEAVETLYGPGSKPHRDTLYAAAMERLSHAYPRDDEARLFAALALLGLNQGVRDVPTYLRAYALAEEVFRRHPDHPGASHYLIHAVDDPEHAALGLDAARALARSSPDADHAQHMTSHIFMALGMWDELVAANQRATHTDPAAGDPPATHRHFCGHYNSWLDYGYLAQGRFGMATALLARCQAQAAAMPDRTPPDATDPDVSALASAVAMWSRWLLDTERWADDLARWQPAIGAAPLPRITWRFAHGIAAARRHDLAGARADLAALQAARAEAVSRAAERPDSSPVAVQDRKRSLVLDLELQGVIRLEAGRGDEAVTLLRQATMLEDGMAYAFGPPYVDKPSHELLGEALLRLGRAREAVAEFQAALRRTPRRPLALRGLARGFDAMGRPADARATRQTLGEVWHGADPGVPGIGEANPT